MMSFELPPGGIAPIHPVATMFSQGLLHGLPPGLLAAVAILAIAVAAGSVLRRLRLLSRPATARLAAVEGGPERGADGSPAPDVACGTIASNPAGDGATRRAA